MKTTKTGKDTLRRLQTSLRMLVRKAPSASAKLRVGVYVLARLSDEEAKHIARDKLAKDLQMQGSNVSAILGKLTAMGIWKVEKSGTKKLYRLPLWMPPKGQ